MTVFQEHSALGVQMGGRWKGSCRFGVLNREGPPRGEDKRGEDARKRRPVLMGAAQLGWAGGGPTDWGAVWVGWG